MSEFQNLDEAEKSVVWLDSNKVVIDRILKDALQHELLLRKSLLDRGEKVFDHRPFTINPNNIYSNPFCNKLLEQFPQDRLWYADVGRSRVVVDDKQYSYHVYFRTFGGTIIDPTVGQFIDLNKEIQAHKSVFRDGILVASLQDAEQLIRITYPQEFEFSILGCIGS